jgi:rhamnosyltransferase
VDPAEDKVLAVGISVYRPDEAMLLSLLAVVRTYGGPVLVHVDGPTGEAISPQLMARLSGDGGIAVLQSARNAGIGAALNGMVDEASRRGCAAVIFFDQDSTPSPSMAQHLWQAFADLEARGWRPAVVGPAPTSDPTAPTKVPHYRDKQAPGAPETCRATDYVIISGSLMTMAVLRDVGPFNAAFRMDGIDVEWCFRARSKGYSIWYRPDVAMEHRVGSGIVALGRLRFPLQSTERMASYAQNQFHLLQLGHVPLWWKLRTLVYVPLQLLVFVMAAPNHRLRRARQLLQTLTRRPQRGARES